VHGASRWVDHRRYPWSDSSWQASPLSSAIFYECHIGTFTPEGTFEAAIDRLDDLVELGVTHLELMPVVEGSGDRGWGYDGAALFAPHQAMGGPEGLKRLIDACHRRHLAVFLDVVYNHLGPVGNYLRPFGPYFTDRYTTPWGEAVNFDGPESDEVRDYFIENACMWLRDYHFDGLRLDAIHAIVDHSAIHFLEQLAKRVKQLEAHVGRHLVVIAENDQNDTRVVHSPEAGGYGLDAQWNEDFHHALHACLTGEQGGYYLDFGRLADLAKVLEKGLVYDGIYSRYRHRRHGRSAEGLTGHHFVGCLQNHDQVGNRAVGDRIGHLISPGLTKIGAAVVLTSPFIPLLFQGEEWGASTPFLYFTDHQESEIAEAVRQGRRREFAAFGWDPESIPDPQAEETFLRSKLDWKERDLPEHREYYDWYRQLIALRKSRPDLMNSDFRNSKVAFDEQRRWLRFHRGSVTVVCNFSDSEQTVPTGTHASKIILLASDQSISTNCDCMYISPESHAIRGQDPSLV
jgi:maltooligosyltrehalose trehalohydrolase